MRRFGRGGEFRRDPSVARAARNTALPLARVRVQDESISICEITSASGPLVEAKGGPGEPGSPESRVNSVLDTGRHAIVM